MASQAKTISTVSREMTAVNLDVMLPISGTMHSYRPAGVPASGASPFRSKAATSTA